MVSWCRGVTADLGLGAKTVVNFFIYIVLSPRFRQLLVERLQPVSHAVSRCFGQHQRPNNRLCCCCRRCTARIDHGESRDVTVQFSLQVFDGPTAYPDWQPAPLYIPSIVTDYAIRPNTNIPLFYASFYIFSQQRPTSKPSNFRTFSNWLHLHCVSIKTGPVSLSNLRTSFKFQELQDEWEACSSQ